MWDFDVTIPGGGTVSGSVGKNGAAKKDPCTGCKAGAGTGSAAFLDRSMWLAPGTDMLTDAAEEIDPRGRPLAGWIVRGAAVVGVLAAAKMAWSLV